MYPRGPERAFLLLGSEAKGPRGDDRDDYVAYYRLDYGASMTDIQ
jgi:hypothetical protein